MANKVHIVRLFIVFSFLFISKLSFPQFPEPKFEHLSIEQGLSQNSVYCIVQDIRGFMWFGTLDGLNKYDGYSFTVYKHDPKDLQSLSSNDINSIYEDQSGVLWIGTISGGLNKFDREKETFTHYKHDPDNPQSLSGNDVLSIYEDQTGVLLIGTDGGGLNKFDREKETFTHYKLHF
jgi:ligand-binding sensor domain-containing protein